MDKESSKSEKHDVCPHCGNSGNFWGVLLILLGGYFLIKDLGLIAPSFPIWPLIMIGSGLYILFMRRVKV